MKTTQERFTHLGGKFEVGIHYTHLIYNNYKIKIPNEYFLSTDVAHQEVLNYYLDMMPKIGEQSGVILPRDFDLEKLKFYPQDMPIIEGLDLSKCKEYPTECIGCQYCREGTMKEMSIYDDWEGMLTCDKCGMRVKK